MILQFLWGKEKSQEKLETTSLYHCIPDGKRLVCDCDCDYVGKATKVATTLGGIQQKLGSILRGLSQEGKLLMIGTKL